MDRASDSGSECWGFESLRAYQARIGRKAYPSFFIFITAALCCQSGFVPCTRLLGKGPAAARRASGAPGCASASGVPKRKTSAYCRCLSQLVKEPRQQRGSSGIIEKRGIEYGELEKGFPKRYSDGGCGCISPPRPSAPKSRKSHGL